MARLVAVAGATGNNGKVIATRLLESGLRVRAIARDAERLRPLHAQGAEVLVGDLGDVGFLAEGFRGADAAFALIPQRFDVADYRADQRRLVRSVTGALAAAGVPYVVALSTPTSRLRLGPMAVLAEFEERLATIPGLAVTLLHPMSYMENHLALIPMIQTRGVSGGAIRASVMLPMVATRDVAAAAVEALLGPPPDGYAARPLLGPRDYSHEEAVRILGAAIDRPDLPYLEFSYQEFRQGLLGTGMSESGADAMVEMSRAYNDGRVQRAARRNVANTTTTTLEDFARDVFAPAYRRQAVPG